MTAKAKKLCKRPWVFLPALVVVLLALTAGPALATKVHVFDSSFGGPCTGAGGTCEPGQLTEPLNKPAGIAVNDESGDVYVVDTGNGRVREFNATGTTVLGEFDGAAAPTGSLSNPTDIAVDNSANPLDPSENDLYVTGEVSVAGETRHVIYKFSSSGTYLGQITAGSGAVAFGELFGVAVDPAGQLWAFQQSNEIDRYTGAAENKFTASCEDPRGPRPGFAVDSEDNLYVNTGAMTIAKLSSTCVELSGEVGSESEASSVAVELGSNNVYLDSLTSVGVFTPGGELIERFGSGHLSEAAGVAVDSAPSQDFAYVVESNADAVRVFRGLLRPTPVTGAPSEPKPTSATLNGTVNPEGLPVTSCVFEYGTSASYEHTTPCEPTPGSGNGPVAVTASITGLQPDTTYHYRVLASNENGPAAGADESLTTPGPGLHGASAIDVTDDSATLLATIDPRNAPTTYYFQYGTTSAYEASAPLPPGLSLGAGEGDVETAPQRIQGLTPDTTYHYRLVAVSELEGKQQTFDGPDQTITTEGVGGELTLPDNRGWELVSPPDKQGALIEPIAETGVVQAAADGSGITYLTNAPTEADPEGYANEVQVLSRRSSSSWSSLDIALPHSAATGKGVGAGPEYSFFNPDLTLSAVQPGGEFNPLLSEEASESTAYLHDLTIPAEACTPASSCYVPFVTRANDTADPFQPFGEAETCIRTGTNGHQATCGPKFEGATEDLSHVVLFSSAPLTPGAGFKQLYEWSAGALAHVTVLPGGEPAPEDAHLGSEQGTRGAISADGSRIDWTTPFGLYQRDMAPPASTVQLDKAEEPTPGHLCSGCESGDGRFEFASAEGTRVFFSDTHKLSADSGANAEGALKSDLYECQITIQAGKLHCALSDLTPERGGESAEVQGGLHNRGGLLGASSDGEYLYFVAKGVQSEAPNARGQHAISGQPNLYLRHGAATSFIATLARGDSHDWEESLSNQPTRVSPNGHYLELMSEARLTGYDNRDLESGAPAAEVYLYDANANSLVCASCDPTGARPVGVEYGKLQPGEGGLVGGHDTWELDALVAANVPGWPASVGITGARYQPRYLSNSGRLFFNSVNALVPQDVNGTQDVYEYDPVGLESSEGKSVCEASSPEFSTASGGCVALISSGSSAQESAFMDASESGDDVFFLTSAKLSPLDVDTSRDIYDAHVCTTAEPCITFPNAQSPPCTTEASCKAAPTPQPSIFGAPASSTFQGLGNPGAAAVVKAKAKPLTRAQKLAAALKVCKKDRSKAKRAKCEKIAHKNYGPLKRAKKKGKK
jgi:NHL repeat